ncbi:MAG: TlpA family protein disulfide reductase [Cyclobacteriaceae bacterium]|nr:TlpA family protein disulfide reductase [Cyclobacteriaceae bacterium]MCH8517888.1 TlpA family protein disulfide reductase [Cyclobacteriaceae bacterium]
MTQISRKQKILKFINSWPFTLLVILILYFSGGLKHVSALMQRTLMATGIVNATPKDEVYGVLKDPLRFVDQQGEIIEIPNGEDKLYFINFWASWCPPCIAEMPDIMKLQSMMAGKPIVFIFPNADKEVEKAENMIAKRGWSIEVQKPMQTMPAIFDHSGIPSTYIINSKGEIIYKKTGVAKYTAKSFVDFLEKGMQ